MTHLSRPSHLLLTCSVPPLPLPCPSPAPPLPLPCPSLQALVPITVEVAVPNDYHKYIIGQRGREVRALMDEFEVQITIPPSEKRLDTITVSGPPSRVEAAKKAVEQKVEQLDAEKEDRVRRSGGWGQYCFVTILMFTLMNCTYVSVGGASTCLSPSPSTGTAELQGSCSRGPQIPLQDYWKERSSD